MDFSPAGEITLRPRCLSVTSRLPSGRNASAQGKGCSLSTKVSTQNLSSCDSTIDPGLTIGWLTVNSMSLNCARHSDTHTKGPYLVGIEHRCPCWHLPIGDTLADAVDKLGNGIAVAGLPINEREALRRSTQRLTVEDRAVVMKQPGDQVLEIDPLASSCIGGCKRRRGAARQNQP